MGSVHSLSEFLNLLARRWLMIVLLTLLGVAAAIGLALSRTDAWETTAVIQVETPVLGGDQQAASGQTARSLQAIEQRLTTRDNLIAMARRLELFDEGALTDDQRVFILRQSIRFQSIASAAGQSFGAPTTVAALLITAQFETPDKAALIANDLAKSVMEMSVARQASRAQDSLAFFQAEERRVSQQIVTLEDEIEAYKNANIASIGGDPANETAAIDSDLRGLSSTTAALDTERRALLAQERLRVTDQRRIGEIDRQLAVLASQRAQLQAQLAALEARVARAPEVERRLGAYNRSMEQLQGQFEQITARKITAETDLRLEQENHNEHFTLLEEAIVPEESLGAGRKKLAIAGAFASLVGSIGLAFALDMTRPVLRNAAQMERELGITPVIVIPELHLPPRLKTPLLPAPSPGEQV